MSFLTFIYLCFDCGSAVFAFVEFPLNNTTNICTITRGYDAAVFRRGLKLEKVQFNPLEAPGLFTSKGLIKMMTSTNTTKHPAIAPMRHIRTCSQFTGSDLGA